MRRNALGNDQSKLGQQPSNLIDLGGALFGEPSTNPMQAECRLLILGLNWNEAHIGSADRFTDSFGIVVVVLAALAIRCHEPGSDDSGIVAELGHFTRPVVRAGASFHANQANW